MMSATEKARLDYLYAEVKSLSPELYERVVVISSIVSHETNVTFGASIEAKLMSLVRDALST